MAIGNKPSQGVATTAPATDSQAKAKSKTVNQELIKQGAAIISSMTDEQRANLNSKSHTLHFKHLLGLSSHKTRRKVSKTDSLDCSTPVGIVLVTDIDIDNVPVIDITKNKDTGINPEDITYRAVKAGEEFVVSYYEFMYLIVRDEYGGLLEAKGDPRGAYFSAKLPAFSKGEAKLPTPTLNLKTGSVKENMVDIDVKTENGWEIKPGYEKFAGLLKKSRPARQAGAKNSTPTPTAMAVALQNLLKIK